MPQKQKSRKNNKTISASNPLGVVVFLEEKYEDTIGEHFDLKGNWWTNGTQKDKIFKMIVLDVIRDWKATENSSERTFSDCGRFLGDLRSSLKSEYVCAQVISNAGERNCKLDPATIRKHYKSKLLYKRATSSA